MEIADQVNKGTLGMETVWVDPINELYRELLEEFSQRAVAPTLPTYLAVQTHLERFCRALCKSPTVNAVIVAHEMPVKDEGTGIFERLPATGTTNPSLGSKLMGMVDVVGYCAMTEREGQDRPVPMAQLTNAKGRRGGDRFDVLGTFRELDLNAWFALMDADAGLDPRYTSSVTTTPQETPENV